MISRLIRLAPLLLPLLAFAQAPAPGLPPAPPEEPALNPALPTLFIAGDSTAAKANGNPHQGWGVPFADYLDPAKVNLANHARGGRSSRTFIREGLWDRLLAQVKAGDVVLLQFGHNDGSPVNEDESVPPDRRRSRGSLPGVGRETRDIVNVVTGQPETVLTYGAYVRRMIADVKAKGATPLLLSPTVCNTWHDGRVERGPGGYRAWNRVLAQETGTAHVDLGRIVADSYQAMGPDRVRGLFGNDWVHTNVAGADFNAAAVVAGLKGLRPAVLKDVFSAKGEAVAADAIGWLNLPEPADPALPSLFLIGDSTVRNDNGAGKGGQWGWGDFLGAHFDVAKLNLVNRAVGGTTGRNFINLGHWERALMLMRPGDFLVIQFGTNDGGPINDDRRAHGSLPGTGEETEAIDNLLTKRPEVVHTNGWYLRKFVREARAAGVTPVLCSLVPRKIWQDGRIVRPVNGSALWARQVAEQEGVAFVDLNELVATRYEALGPEQTNVLFADTHTHTSREGAIESAAIAAAALRALPGDPLGQFAR